QTVPSTVELQLLGAEGPGDIKIPQHGFFCHPALHIAGSTPYIPRNSVLWLGICSLPSPSVSPAFSPACSWPSPWFRSVMRRPAVAAASAAVARTPSIPPHPRIPPRGRLPLSSAP